MHPNARTRRLKAHLPANLSRRPAKPARWRGRVQLAAERVLHLYGEASTADVIDYAYALRLLMLQEARRDTFARASRRALASIGAVKVGRAGTRGRPHLWGLR